MGKEFRGREQEEGQEREEEGGQERGERRRKDSGRGGRRAGERMNNDEQRFKGLQFSFFFIAEIFRGKK